MRVSVRSWQQVPSRTSELSRPNSSTSHRWGCSSTGGIQILIIQSLLWMRHGGINQGICT